MPEEPTGTVPTESTEEAPTSAPETAKPDSGPPEGATSQAPTQEKVEAAPAADDNPDNLAIKLTQVDGTPSWNWQDDSDSNGIVRTNDLITYTVQLTANGAQQDTKVTLEIPQGVVLNRIPAFCGTGSTLTPDASEFAAPELPTTATSWQSLGQQTLVCALGDLGSENAGLDMKFDVTAKVRPEVPNGTVLPAQAAVTTTEVTNPLDSNSVEATVAAQAQYDVSKNGLMPIDPNGGDINNGNIGQADVACAFDPSKRCIQQWYSIALSVPQGAKGNSPANEISFVDNLDPNAFFGAGTTSNPNWDPSFAPRIRSVGVNYGADPSVPYGGFTRNANADAANSVRDSGTPTFTGTPGGAYTITFKNADLTGYTYPSKNANGTPVADQQRAAVITGSISVEYPVEAVPALGVAQGGTWTLTTKNTLGQLQVTDINGTGNAANADDPRNNNRVVKTVATLDGGFGKYFVGVPGSPGFQKWQDFNEGLAQLSGLPAQTAVKSGDAPVSSGQTVISLLQATNRASTSLPTTTQNGAICDVWDVNQFHIAPGDYPGAAAGGGTSQSRPSNGEAVWLSGTFGDGVKSLEQVQYGVVSFTPDPSVNAGVAPAVNGCADSRITWFDSIAAAGGATKVGAVRAHVINGRGTNSEGSLWVSIALKATDAPRTTGAVMPNYASASSVWTASDDRATLTEVLAGSQTRNSYNGENHTGVGLGDRVLAADLFSSINKQVQDPVSGAWVDEIQAFTGGQTANFRLIPSVSSGNPTAESGSVFVEDCIPKGFTIETSSQPYSLVPEADANLSCKPGETYVSWNLGAVKVSDELEPITYAVKISALVPAGTYVNTARITAQGDPAALDPEKFARVTDTQNVQIQSLRGVFLEKRTLTPQTQVNLPGQAQDELTSWEVRVGNMDTLGPEDIDVIDALPQAGLSDNNFTGTSSFVSAEITEWGSSDPDQQRSKLYYTTAATVNRNPNNAVNTNADGSLTAIWSETLPADPSTVTGVRLVRDGVFDKGEQLAFRIDTVGVDNRAGDAYRNLANAVAHKGLNGLMSATARSTVVSSSLGDTVWWDLDRDGIQDDGEPGAKDVPVKLTGTDDLGNAVEITAVTDADGKYVFANLRASDAKGYTVTFSKPDGTEFTKQHAPDSTTSNDSDAASDSGTSDPVVLGPDAKNLDIDAGLLPFSALMIVKTLDGVGANAQPKDAQYVFDVVCTFADETVFEQEVTISGNGTTSIPSDELGPIPTGASCVITETDDGGADAAPAPLTVLLAWDEQTPVGKVTPALVTNRFSAGTISVTKELAGDQDVVDSKSDTVFEILVTCQVQDADTGDRADVYSGTLKVKGGQTVTATDENGDPVLLPVGATCFAEETGTGGASGVKIDHDSFENGVVVEAGKPDELQQLGIEVVNTFEMTEGALIINKVLEGKGVEQFSKTDELTFEVVCTRDGETVFEQNVTLAVDGQKIVTSGELGPIPGNSKCVVTETGHGNADDAAAPVEVTIPWDSASNTAGTVTASLTNYYSAGQVQLQKALEGDATRIEQVKDTKFEFRITCQIEERNASGETVRTDLVSGTWKLKGGEIVILGVDDSTPLLLPVGARCFGEETDNGGATRATISHDSFENAVEVTKGSPDELQMLTISAVNTFTCEDGTCDPETPGKPEKPQGPNLAVTGGSVAGIAAAGIGLLGFGLLLLLRRRREANAAE